MELEKLPTGWWICGMMRPVKVLMYPKDIADDRRQVLLADNIIFQYTADSADLFTSEIEAYRNYLIRLSDEYAELKKSMERNTEQRDRIVEYIAKLQNQQKGIHNEKRT